MNEDEWKDLADDDSGEPSEDTYVVRPREERPDLPTGRGALPVFKVLYGPAGAVRTDLARAHRQMNIMAAMSRKPADPSSN